MANDMHRRSDRRRLAHPPRFAGGMYEAFAFYYNLQHVSNAVALWLGMRPADIFVYVFLPPFLLDLSVRIDYFMFKKVRRHKAKRSLSAAVSVPCGPAGAFAQSGGGRTPGGSFFAAMGP